MIQTPLAFEHARKSGRMPQIVVAVRLLNYSALFVDSGVELSSQVYQYDGVKKYDGSFKYGDEVKTVYRGLIGVGNLVEGGDVSAQRIGILGPRKATTTIELDNTDGGMSELLLNEPLVAKPVEIRLTYPEIPATTQMPARFTGEIDRVTLGRSRMILDVASA